MHYVARCLSLAVYFVWSALEWESTPEMWLQHCNFDKRVTVKVFWRPDAATLPDFPLKTQIALLILDFLWIYLNFCQRLLNVTTGPLFFL